MPDPSLIADLAAIVRAVALTPAETSITPASRFVEDLGVDSFDMVGIVFHVQERYGVVVGEDDLPALTNLGQLAAYIAARDKPEAA